MMPEVIVACAILASGNFVADGLYNNQIDRGMLQKPVGNHRKNGSIP
jgi:hypothetical protein